MVKTTLGGLRFRKVCSNIPDKQYLLVGDFHTDDSKEMHGMRGSLMIYRQKQNYILVWLVLCIVLGGVCFEKVQADSFFAWGKAQIVEAIGNDHEETMEESLCTGKVLTGGLEFRTRNTDKEGQTRPFLRLFENLVLVSFLPQVSVLFLETVGRRLEGNNQSHTVIMHFIHIQDGEKE